MRRLRLFSSLKSRIAIFATVLFLAAVWGMALRSAGELRSEERQLLSAQQLAAAGFIADSIGAALRLHTEALAAAAAGMPAGAFADPRRLAAYLGERHTLYRFFPRGVCAIDREGRCVAEHPRSAGRTGAYYGDQDFFRAVMASGHGAIGRPQVDKTWRQAGVVLAVPVTDERNQVVGVLAGTLTIPGSEVFQVLTSSRTATAGNILVISPRDGVSISDARGKRVLEALPAEGENPLYDRTLAAAFEGSELIADAHGVERLASAAAVAGTGWFVVYSMPAEQAFAPIRGMVAAIYRDAAILSLIIAGLIWLFVRAELAALGRSAKALKDMTAGTLPFHPLPMEGSDEIARMVESFNDLQEQIGRQQAALRASEARFRQMFEASAWITYLVDPETRRIVDANRAAAEFWGYGTDELQGMDIGRIDTAPPEEIDAGFRLAMVDEPVNRSWHHRLSNGEIRDVETFACPLLHGNRMLLYVVAFDITERRQREEQETVRNRIFELLARGGDLKEILALVVRYVEQTRGKPLCAILLLDDEGKRLRSGAAGALPKDLEKFCDGAEVGENAGVCGVAAWRNERVIVDDVGKHPSCAARLAAAGCTDAAACWSQPIRDSAGKPIGVLMMLSRRSGAPAPGDVDLIQQAANLAAVAIEKKRSDAELQLASSVYQASDEAILVTDAENRIIAVNPAFTRLTGYALEEVRGRNPRLLSAGRTARAEYEAMWQALRAAGQWQGEIWNRRKNGDEYAEWLTINTLRDGSGGIHRYIAMFSDITEKKRTAELVWRQANYDTLTGLPNRNLFYDRLNQEVKKMQRGGHLLALLYIDLDRFKEVNDAYGHDAGDKLLTETASRIAGCVRDADTVARLSGDEFAVVLPGVTDMGRVEQVAKDIVAGLARPFDVGGHVAYVSASVGIALYPADADNAEALLKAADHAMYAAKEGGRNSFSYFAGPMAPSARLKA